MASDRERVERMRDAMRRGYDRLIAVATAAPFQSLVEELFSRPRVERPGFVRNVVLVESERLKRNVVIPPDVLVQRSSFGDRRPTLFCIKLFLPDDCQAPWQNVNITVDDMYDNEDVPRDGMAWRPALSFDRQAALMTAGLTPAQMAAL